MSEELSKNLNAGKHSPGPVYFNEEANKYDKAPGWAFGTADRPFGAKAKYDFYENAGFLDDPIGADHSRKERTLAPKIGTEPRMPLNTIEKTPGPQYFPHEKPTQDRPPKYSFGFRRDVKGSSVLQNLTATPGSVGPGRYVPEASSNPSNKHNFSKWTLPKAGRTGPEARPVDKHQTYDTRSSIGRQNDSKKKSSASTHFGTAERSHQNKLGSFKDQMTGVTKVRMPHPTW